MLGWNHSNAVIISVAASAAVHADMIFLLLWRRDNCYCGLSMPDGITGGTGEQSHRSINTHTHTRAELQNSPQHTVIMFLSFTCVFAALLWEVCQSLTSFLKKNSRHCLRSGGITPQTMKIEAERMKSWWGCCLVDGWRCSDSRLMGSSSFLPFNSEACS